VNVTQKAQGLIVEIGAPAIPALEIGRQRGDNALKRHCEQCLAAIRGQPAPQSQSSKTALPGGGR